MKASLKTPKMLDFERICRLCLGQNKQTFDLFSSFCLKRNILYHEMLKYCTKLEPAAEDGLPKLICKECIRLLKRVYTFNIQCEISDQKLRQYVQPVTEKTNQSAATTGEIKEYVKNETYIADSDSKMLKLLDQNVVSDIKDDIKIEPTYNDDPNDGWDADDNMLLEEIKVAKMQNVLENKDKPKKRGRRRRRDEMMGPSESKRPHQCDECGKVLSTRSNLKAHKVCHSEHRPFQCKDCSATFRGHSALFQHKKIHSGETPYHCEYCPKQFSRRSGLVNHTRIHTGEKHYRCEVCLKSFVQSSQLYIHMRRHQGDKSFLCHDCGKGFAIKSDLKVHQRVHNGEKPYPCRLCDKTFATSGNLAIHVRIHNKEIRYHCKECQRGFVTHGTYSLHVKRHKGQKDHHCECGKTFYTSSALKQHKVVHTGEKKYQCKICDRKFTQTSHLSRHFKRDHLKPGCPVPSSDQFKIILQNRQETDFRINDVRIDVDVGAAVKCEGA